MRLNTRIIIVIVGLLITIFVYWRYSPAKLRTVNWQFSGQLKLVDHILTKPEALDSIINNKKVADISSDAKILNPKYLNYLKETIVKGGFSNYKIEDMTVGDEYHKDSTVKSKLLIFAKSETVSEKIWFYFDSYPNTDWKLKWIFVNPDTFKL